MLTTAEPMWLSLAILLPEEIRERKKEQKGGRGGEGGGMSPASAFSDLDGFRCLGGSRTSSDHPVWQDATAAEGKTHSNPTPIFRIYQASNVKHNAYFFQYRNVHILTQDRRKNKPTERHLHFISICPGLFAPQIKSQTFYFKSAGGTLNQQTIFLIHLSALVLQRLSLFLACWLCSLIGLTLFRYNGYE